MLITCQEGCAADTKETEVFLTGRGKSCPSCDCDMYLVLQSGCNEEDYVSGWWWCLECRSTSKLKIDASMLM